MAQALSNSFLITSDEMFDYLCTFCAENSKNTEASFCCNVCSKAICVSCKTLHQQLFNTHKVLDKDNRDKWTIQRTSSSELCKYHHGKVLDQFCQDHDQLACDVCVQSKHRGCQKVQHVSVSSKGISKSKEMKETLESISKIEDQLKQIKQNKVSNKTKLQQKYQQIQTSIKKLRQKLDMIETNTTQVLDSLLSQLTTDIDTEVNTCQFFEREIRKVTEGINSKRNIDESSAFRELKRLQNTSTDAQIFLQNINPDDVTLTFTPDQEIEKLLSTVDTLGEVTSNSRISSTKPTKQTLQPATTPSTPATSSPDHVYRVENIKKCNVATENEDAFSPAINGLCVLSDGNTVITDYQNNKLKLLDTVYRVIDKYDLSARPTGLCHITGCEVAVTAFDLPPRNEIQFLNVVRGFITSNRTIKLDHVSAGIVSYYSQFFVGSGYDGLYVYDKDGNNKRRLYEGEVNGVTVNNKDQILYVGSGSVLVMLNFDGKVLSRFHDKELVKSSAIAITSNGSVFVADYNSHNVIQVDKEGSKKMGTLVDRNYDVYRPWALCVNYQTNELIVGQSGGILVIKLK